MTQTPYLRDGAIIMEIQFFLKQWFFMEVVLPSRGPYGNLWKFSGCQKDGLERQEHKTVIC